VVRAIESVLAQECGDFEILVIDDGSTDDIAGALSRFSDSRLRLVQQPNGGASQARNTGIDLARGAFVALLDSDDMYLPHHLSAMKVILDRSPDVAAYCQVIALRGPGRSFVKPPRAIGDGENMANYLICDRGFVQTSGLCLPIQVARSVRYRNDAKFGDDTDFAIRLQLAGCRFVMADTPGVIWADDAEHERLSDQRQPLGNLPWLEDLRPDIPKPAYHGYRGWHVAKSLFHVAPLKALGLFAGAVVRGAYSPRLAAQIFLQIVLSNNSYRRLTNRWLANRRNVESKNEPS